MRSRSTICTALVALHLAACTTLSTAPYGGGSQLTNPVRAGDRVWVTTDSTRRQLDVTSANAQEICGKDECIPAERIHFVEREEVDVLRTAGAILVVVALVALVAAVHGGSFGYPGFPPGT
jgi:hypothetical protein